MFPKTRGNEVRAKENTISLCRASAIRTTCLICIGEDLEGCLRTFVKEQPMRYCVLEISEDPLDSLPMDFSWSMHELVDTIYSKCQIWTSEGQVLE
jgi:hypothetical protein